MHRNLQVEPALGGDSATMSFCALHFPASSANGDDQALHWTACHAVTRLLLLLLLLLLLADPSRH
jgi:hypothetical protein